MSLHRSTHARAVLLLAIAVLPWIALSRLGEWGASPAASLPRDHGAIEALTSRSVVMPDRVLFSATGKRADGTRHISTTPPNWIGVSLLPLLGWELCPRDSDLRTEPFLLHPACRGPPLLASG